MTSKIIGTGSYLPKKNVTNDDLSQFLDTNDEWISSRTGIKNRHIADLKEGETCSFMATQAAKQALLQANLQPEDIDLIVVATISADYKLPSLACLVQEQLGAFGAAAFDISAACAGSIYGLNIAHNFIVSNQYKNVLFIGAEVMSSVVNWQDRNTAILFGDAASACILSKSDDNKSGFIDFKLYADRRQHKCIYAPKGGSLNKLDEEGLRNFEDKLVMNGRETFKFAVRSICDSIQSILTKNNLTKEDVTFVVPHQANLRIIEAIAKYVDVPMEKFLVNLDECANTSAASLMLAYDQANKKDLLKPKDLLLMLAIGAGFVWGAALYRV